MGLTRKGFEQWLRTKGKDEVVGRRSKEQCCPLARYLRDQGYPQAEVNAYTYSLEGNTIVTRPLRIWAMHFVEFVDLATYAPTKDEHVTAAEARSVLRRV